MAKPVIADPWAVATVEGVKVSAGYMTVSNPGDINDRLVSASSPAAGKTELHIMETADGVMKMRMAGDGIATPAGGTVNLAPGGAHLMFLDLPAALKDGTTIPVTLTFEKAGSIEVQFAVRPRTAADKSADHAKH
jgi:copper(I)-binding protein